MLAANASGWIRARRALVALLALAATGWVLGALADATAGGSRAQSARLDPLERDVIRIVNRQRAKRGLPRLAVSRGLARAADAHSADLARSNRFSHSSSDGTPAGHRVRRYVAARRVGEAIALLSDESARRTVGLWRRSRPHWRLLMSPEFRRLGVGRRADRRNGRRVLLVTADLASRR